MEREGRDQKPRAKQVLKVNPDGQLSNASSRVHPPPSEHHSSAHLDPPMSLTWFACEMPPIVLWLVVPVECCRIFRREAGEQALKFYSLASPPFTLSVS